jgi:hypothetical protein
MKRRIYIAIGKVVVEEMGRREMAVGRGRMGRGTMRV